VDSTAQKTDKSLADTCQHFWKRVYADNLHMDNCITNAHCVWILQFPWVHNMYIASLCGILSKETAVLQSL